MGLNDIYQAHQEGSFAALFASAIEPYLARIARIEETNKRIKEENKKIRVDLAELRKIAKQASLTATKAASSPAKLNRNVGRRFENYDKMLEHFKNNFTTVKMVKRDMLLSGGGWTTRAVRAELAMEVDHRIANEHYMANRVIAGIINDAGLDGRIHSHTLISNEGKDYPVSFFKIKKKDE